MTDLTNIAAGLIVAALDNALPLAVYAVLQIADVISTLRFLKAEVREGNPIVAWMMDHFGAAWILVKLLFAALVAVLILYSGTAWPLWALNALYAAGVIWNWRRGFR